MGNAEYMGISDSSAVQEGARRERRIPALQAAMGSWVYAATLVAVVAMTVAEGLAEESDMSANAEKWAYVPPTPNAGDRQKEAAELLQKTKKGRWVHVPVGKTAEGVLEEEEMLKAKILSDATAARKASELKGKAKRREERTQKRILGADDEEKQIASDMAKANMELEDVNTALVSPSQDYSSMKENMQMKEKLHRKIKKLKEKKASLDDVL